MNKNNFVILSLHFCLISFLLYSCAGTHGKIKNYEFDYSKAKVNKAIKKFLESSPQYKVPDTYSDYTWHYSGNRNTENMWIQQANADSVSFSFYFPDENIITWCSFVGHADAWYSPSCTLSLIGYIKPNESKWQFNADISSKEKEVITDKFESVILNRINNEL